MKHALVIPAVALAPHAGMAHGHGDAGAATASGMGHAADPAKVSRSVDVSMDDAMRFSPAVLTVKEWVKHLEAAGFTTTVTLVSDTAAIRKRLGMPDRLASCHMAMAGDYVRE
jgi:hypothetical protein